MQRGGPFLVGGWGALSHWGQTVKLLRAASRQALYGEHGTGEQLSENGQSHAVSNHYGRISPFYICSKCFSFSVKMRVGIGTANAISQSDGYRTPRFIAEEEAPVLDLCRRRGGGVGPGSCGRFTA